jgi:hypothetical protein
MRESEVQVGNSCLHKQLDVTERTWDDAKQCDCVYNVQKLRAKTKLRN